MKEGFGRCPVLPPENGRAQSSGLAGEGRSESVWCAPTLHLTTKHASSYPFLESGLDRQGSPSIVVYLLLFLHLFCFSLNLEED